MPTGLSATEFEVEYLVVLMTIASLVALAVKRIKLPYSIALVLVGLLLSFFQVLQPVILDEHLVLFIFLPALLFESCWNLPIRELKENASPVFFLAILGAVITAGVIGGAIHYGLGFSLPIAILFGTMVANTDPVSVLAILRQMRIEPRYAAILEGESLFNDGTGVVLFKIALAVTLLSLHGEANLDMPFTLGAFVQFLTVVAGGATVGLVIGGAVSAITSRVNDALLEISLTTIVAYGSFLAAESIVAPGVVDHMHLSGVIATVTAGLIMGNVARHQGMSPTTQVVIHSFWEYVAFFVNSLIFLLIGLEMNVGFLGANWEAILWGIGAVLLGRAVTVYGLVPIANRWMHAPITLPWQHIMVWGGLRGALCMALALSLPRELAERDQLIAMCFGVVLFSLLIQGLSLPKLFKFLKLGGQTSDELQTLQRYRAELISAHQAQKRLQELQALGEISPIKARAHQSAIEQEIEETSKAMHTLLDAHPELAHEIEREVAAELLDARKAALNHLASRGVVSPAIVSDMKLSLNESQLAWELGQIPNREEEEATIETH